ncbi:YdaS family helix-turn-helix protein [Pseudoxanthomonas sp.]|uniref:transcriptional regulator n=1 Tax=Pseudoxanthomonas sp. TaxID=1871049 RepID=UPI00260732C8|nr:YdaS family helix-turn-helix protein [Pseudoxanthomonas sp.]WDS36210.1 MAG: Cro/CI family transcriptional regulator [Pseudoxanthomonas sp.]
MDAIKRAIESVGNASELARRLGVVPMTITQWKRRKQIPAERCLEVEAITGISRHDLRPDVFGPAPAKKPKPAQSEAA